MVPNSVQRRSCGWNSLWNLEMGYGRRIEFSGFRRTYLFNGCFVHWYKWNIVIFTVQINFATKNLNFQYLLIILISPIQIFDLILETKNSFVFSSLKIRSAKFKTNFTVYTMKWTKTGNGNFEISVCKFLAFNVYSKLI